MIIDDENRLWISTIVDDQDVYQWWVLTGDGELQARFRWTWDSQIEVVKIGYLYAQETIEETGEEQLVRYQIEMD